MAPRTSISRRLLALPKVVKSQTQDVPRAGKFGGGPLLSDDAVTTIAVSAGVRATSA
jgi:hypothetical protein